MHIWKCKIGTIQQAQITPGADAPMRSGIHNVFKELVGIPPDFIFSGWNSLLSPSEYSVVYDLPPATNEQIAKYYFDMIIDSSVASLVFDALLKQKMLGNI
jgi:hypothetical protein